MRKMGSGRHTAPFLFAFLLLCAVPVSAQQVDLVPGTTLAAGRGSIARAWFEDPTTRYPHGALGDTIEAGTLVLQARDGKTARIVLPENRVFEDLMPRLVAPPALGDAVMVIESDSRLGARLSFYSFSGGAVRLLGSTPFIGTGHRWLAPIGIGDFDGDGIANEIALVAMPHLAGLLRVYRILLGETQLLAEAAGYSNHAYGRAEIVMSSVLRRGDQDMILVPDRERRRLVLLSLREGRWREEQSEPLPSPLRRLLPVGAGFRIELDDGGMRSSRLAPP